MSVFKQGSKDFWRGQIVNPYPMDSPKGKNWEMGFNQAYFSNREKVIKREQSYAEKDSSKRSEGVRQE